MTHPFHAARLRVALLCLAAAAGAHAAPAPAPNAADPQAAVPATRYQPAFDWRLDAPAPTRPDQHWRDSNAVVAGTNAMSLTMPGMAGHAMHTGAQAPAPEAAAHHHHAGMAMPAPPKEEQR